MTISDYERNEFHRLTADLTPDVSALKKAAKLERATTMSYMALPSRSVLKKVALASFAMLGLTLTIVGFQTSDVVLIIEGLVSSSLLLAAIPLIARQEASAKREMGTDSH